MARKRLTNERRRRLAEEIGQLRSELRALIRLLESRLAA
jgi:hypothetical protein